MHVRVKGLIEQLLKVLHGPVESLKVEADAVTESKPYGASAPKPSNGYQVNEATSEQPLKKNGERRELQLVDPTDAAGFIGLGWAYSMGYVGRCHDIKVRKRPRSKFDD